MQGLENGGIIMKNQKKTQQEAAEYPARTLHGTDHCADNCVCGRSQLH